MKRLIPFLLFAAAGCAQTGSTPEAKPAYISEAPLPEGWPQPGPYETVVEKQYPAYRAAITKGRGSMLPFFRLFDHINKRGIPMTAPVEMAVESKGDKLEQTSMAFLYQNAQVGSTGPAGSQVEVRDMPSFKALSYTWQGGDSQENVARAKAALEASLRASNRTAKEFRMLGYNGPDIPRAQQTFELLAVFEKETN